MFLRLITTTMGCSAAAAAVTNQGFYRDVNARYVCVGYGEQEYIEDCSTEERRRIVDGCWPENDLQAIQCSARASSFSHSGTPPQIGSLTGLIVAPSTVSPSPLDIAGLSN